MRPKNQTENQQGTRRTKASTSSTLERGLCIRGGERSKKRGGPGSLPRLPAESEWQSLPQTSGASGHETWLPVG